MSARNTDEPGAAFAAWPGLPGGASPSAAPFQPAAAAGVRPQALLFETRPAAPGRAVYAALDLGTNNCRLLIARPSYDGFRVVDAFSRIVRLGEGLAITGRLSDAAIERAIEALKVCRLKLDQRGVMRAKLIATEACRSAANGPAFIERVRREAGLALVVIDREREAFLAAAGCVSLADPAARSIVLFDIGGGSTEIVWVRQALDGAGAAKQEVVTWASLPVGVVSLADRYGGIDVPPALFEAMTAEVAAALAPFAAAAKEAPADAGFHLLGTSGTVTTVAGIHLNLARYDRRRVDGMWMSAAEVDAVMAQLLGMSFPERAANGCIGADRADLVLAGCAIFEAIRRAFPAERVRIADRGLREGLLMEMMHEDQAWAPARQQAAR